MDRNYSPDVSETLPPYSEDGTPGYFDDGTTITPQWCNQLTEEMRNLLVALGVTPSALSDTQLRDALVPLLTEALALSDKIEVGNPLDTGYQTLIDTEGGEVGPLYGFIQTAKLFASFGVYIGTRGSTPKQVIDEDADASFRNVEATGDVDVDGDVSAARIETTGDAAVGGNLTVAGSATANDINVPSGSNKVSDRETGPTSIDAHAHVDIVVINPRVGENSRIYHSLAISGGADDAAPLVASIYGQEEGGFVIRVQNVGASAFSGTTTVDYWILNPKAA